MKLNTDVVIVTSGGCPVRVSYTRDVTVCINVRVVYIGVVDVNLIKRLNLMSSYSNDTVKIAVVCTCSFIINTSATNTHLTIDNLMI